MEDSVAASKNQEREAREARDRLKRYNARQAVHTHQVTRRRRDNIFAVLGVIVVAALATATQVFYFTAGPGRPVASPSPSASASPNVGNVPSPDLSEHRTWTGELDLNAVPLAISLDGAAAPQAVAAFVQDVQDGYYTGKTCHRLVNDPGAGLIQCGSEDGTGGSATDFSYGPVENAPADGIYKRGIIAIARSSGKAYSQDHQFFIVFADATLPSDAAGGYTVIGAVTSGLDQLETDIVSGGIAPGGSSADDGSPVIPTTITKVTIQ
jgi:peptidyl-prolyl cis-trans isomerase B (cyclophilin B)